MTWPLNLSQGPIKWWICRLNIYQLQAITPHLSGCFVGHCKTGFLKFTFFFLEEHQLIPSCVYAWSHTTAADTSELGQILHSRHHCPQLKWCWIAHVCKNPVVVLPIRWLLLFCIHGLRTMSGKLGSDIRSLPFTHDEGHGRLSGVRRVHNSSEKKFIERSGDRAAPG